MTKYLKRGEQVVEKLAEHDESLWVVSVDPDTGTPTGSPWTSQTGRWEPYTLPPLVPKVGDIIAYGTSEYRVLGVTDTYMIIIAKRNWDGGGFPLPGDNKYRSGEQTEAVVGRPAQAFIRKLPDPHFKLKERL